MLLRPFAFRQKSEGETTGLRLCAPAKEFDQMRQSPRGVGAVVERTCRRQGHKSLFTGSKACASNSMQMREASLGVKTAGHENDPRRLPTSSVWTHRSALN